MMTIKDCLNRTVDASPEAVALRFKRDKRWQTITYAALRERAWHVSEMLVRLGLKQGDRVAIYRENSPEWFELYLGIVGIGAIAVPVDAKLREQEVSHIFHDCGVSVIFASDRFSETLLGLDERLPGLRAIVLLDCSEVPSLSKYASYEALFEEVSIKAMQEGRAYDRLSPTDSSPASFIYTSGTTGRQKGAVLTHRNFISNVEAVCRVIRVVPSDNFMLVLPLHHSFAFTGSLLLPVYAGCQVSLVQNLKTIKQDMAACSPTVFLAVPLLLEKILSRIQDGIASSRLTSLLFKVGLAKVIGRKVHKSFGGALRVMVSGGAPISSSTLENWMKLGFYIIEGYGITETAPVLAINPIEAPRVGTVGMPIDGVEIRILNPNAEGIGEITARGENVMQGYYNNPEETAKVLVDGWYHTGDLGYIDEKGYLVISGRKKSLIVNREGKNIYPEEVELQVMKSAYVLECLAIGYRDAGEEIGERVGLIVVPNQEVFDSKEQHEGRRLSQDEIEELVRKDIRKMLGELSEYKRPRRIEVRFEEFEKTTTQKIKRYLYTMNLGGG